MVKLTLDKNLNITKENLTEILSNKFSAQGYEITMSNLIGADIAVKKTGAVGVAIKIKHKTDNILIKINGYAPSVAFRLFLYGLIPILIVMPKWKKLEREIADFIQSDEFKNNFAE